MRYVVMVLLGFMGLVLVSAQTEATPVVGRGAASATPESTDEAQESPACEFAWFFDEIETTGCPTGEVVETEAAFQRFEYGYMLWTESDDLITVLHMTEGEPMWVRVADPYIAGDPERDYDWSETQPPQSTQPRMGFGTLWREDDNLRERIGWAVQAWEFVYTTEMQTSDDGTIYLSDPNGRVFQLLPDGLEWRLYP